MRFIHVLMGMAFMALAFLMHPVMAEIAGPVLAAPATFVVLVAAAAVGVEIAHYLGFSIESLSFADLPGVAAVAVFLTVAFSYSSPVGVALAIALFSIAAYRHGLGHVLTSIRERWRKVTDNFEGAGIGGPASYLRSPGSTAA